MAYNTMRVVLINPETGDEYAIMADGEDFDGPAVSKHDFIRAVLINPATGDPYKAEGGGEPGPAGPPGNNGMISFVFPAGDEPDAADGVVEGDLGVRLL